MSTRARTPLILIACFVVAAVVALVVAAQARSGDDAAAAGTGGTGASGGAGPAQVVRDDSHRLGAAPADAPVFVEFLDFECEACRAAFPVIEELREEYAGRVSFVIRYFPIPSHANAERAAVAVEAAAQQGQLEAMYQRMYQTQAEWGEQQDPKDAVFRGFAEDLGLDMDAYDAAVADPATAERVERDRQDGLALGVQGTPTFFLDGERLEPTSVQDLRDRLDAALRD